MWPLHTTEWQNYKHQQVMDCVLFLIEIVLEPCELEFQLNLSQLTNQLIIIEIIRSLQSLVESYGPANQIVH